ncbi:MAG: tol-pal system protein YbgF, partial [Wenzhouxiangellaceae bacterium]
MRFFPVKTILTALVAGAVLATPGVAQQAGTDASRVVLELQQMREELRELRGMVEAQGQELENLRRRQRDQYIDLDRRLGNLPAGSPMAPESRTEPVTTLPEPAIDAATRPDRSIDGPIDRPTEAPPERAAAGDVPELRAPIDPDPEIVTLADPGAGGARALREPTPAEQQAYDRAFQALRETRYADAAEGFDRFLQDHADSSYAPNALYWLGEVYYVTRDFETALAQFNRLQEIYPDSGKQPDALLKIGFSHYELGQWQRARGALEQVVSQYPNSNYSRLAENR